MNTKINALYGRPIPGTQSNCNNKPNTYNNTLRLATDLAPSPDESTATTAVEMA